MRRALEDYQQRVQVEMDKASLQAARLGHERIEAEARAQRRQAIVEASRVLARNERCMGGTVVRVAEREGVPTYEQVSQNGIPVRCLGSKRL